MLKKRKLEKAKQEKIKLHNNLVKEKKKQKKKDSDFNAVGYDFSSSMEKEEEFLPNNLTPKKRKKAIKYSNLYFDS